MNRRAVLRLFAVTALLGGCHPIPSPTSDAGSAFVTSASSILANLQTWLAEIRGDAPLPAVLTAVIAAQATVTIAQNALATYAASGGSVCNVLQSAVTAAVNSAEAVLAAMVSAGVAVPTLATVAVESAGTILDAILGAACVAPSSRRQGAFDLRTGDGSYLAPHFATHHIPWVPLDPSAVCPAP